MKDAENNISAEWTECDVLFPHAASRLKAHTEMTSVWVMTQDSLRPSAPGTEVQISESVKTNPPAISSRFARPVSGSRVNGTLVPGRKSSGRICDGNDRDPFAQSMP